MWLSQALRASSSGGEQRLSLHSATEETEAHRKPSLQSSQDQKSPPVSSPGEARPSEQRRTSDPRLARRQDGALWTHCLQGAEVSLDPSATQAPHRHMLWNTLVPLHQKPNSSGAQSQSTVCKQKTLSSWISALGLTRDNLLPYNDRKSVSATSKPKIDKSAQSHRPKITAGLQH